MQKVAFKTFTPAQGRGVGGKFGQLIRCIVPSIGKLDCHLLVARAMGSFGYGADCGMPLFGGEGYTKVLFPFQHRSGLK